jgi:carotenoid 1,2-hydratase
VFSPYYYWTGRDEPENHICLNVALYGRRNRWAMTERGRKALGQTADTFTIGPSSLHWDGEALVVTVEERAVPHLTPIRGTVRITPTAMNARAFDIDSRGLHHWRPIAPAARAEVRFDSPEQAWSGPAYIDMNWGEAMLEEDFLRWDWSRVSMAGGRSAILYDSQRLDGSAQSLALRFAANGELEELEAPPRMRLPGTLWRVPRWVQADDPAAVREVKRLEDAPFYARCEIATQLFGEAAHGVHETVDARRFGTRWVKLLLPWRMPRVA